MSPMKTFNILIAVAFLWISYSLYTSVPSNLEDPWIVRTYIAALRSANFMADVLEYVTNISSVTTLRCLVEAIYTPASIFSGSHLIIKDLKIGGVSVRLYKPKTALAISPCILYFHGGGWTLFSTVAYNAVTSDLAEHTNIVVISVDYRKSPDFPFPVPFDDCLKVTQHILQYGSKYEVDSTRVALVGDSTGASLAAAVALRLSEEDPDHISHVKLQVLLQPVLQAFSFDTPSYRHYAETTFLGRSQVIKFWCYYLGIQPTHDTMLSFQRNEHVSPSLRTSIYAHYLSEFQLPEFVREKSSASLLDKYTNKFDHNLVVQVESKVINPFVSPLIADNLNLCPQTYILVTEYDVVRDDGLLYAARLRAANVPVHLKYVDNQSHFYLAPKPSSDWFTFTSANQTWFEIYNYLIKNL
ncbi:Neutral cholesterol ester hydrolase 1 [Bulinus truncatus]|nr:Neutral cholesterol ester hydrolase 1 [Bulinus truncatus]